MKNNDNKNSAARIRANNKYNRAHYKKISADLKPDEVEFIKTYAKDHNISIAQLILKSVQYIADNNIEL